MLNYEMFKEELVTAMKGMIPDDFELNLREVTKVNGIFDGITVIPKNSNGQTVSATLYIQDLYKDLERHTVDEIAAEAVELIVDRTINNSIPDVKTIMRPENVYMVAINADYNRDLLQNVPYRTFEDLAIIYKLNVGSNKNGIGSVTIDNSIAERMGVTEEKLYEIAKINTKTLFPGTVTGMMELIMRKIGIPDEDFFERVLDDEEETMAVISNTQGVNGAVYMLDKEMLNKVTDILGGVDNFYILPSSIHEVICVNANIGSPEQLGGMVESVNGETVSVSERLSNNVYHYNCKTKKLSVAYTSEKLSIGDEAYGFDEPTRGLSM